MQRLLRVVRNPWFLSLVGLVLAYTAIGFLLLPFLIRHYAPDLGKEYLKRPVAVGEVRFNPFRFTLDVRDFALSEAGGEPLVRLKRLFVDFEPTGLFRGVWTLADLRLEQPSVFAVIDREARLNLAKIADDLPESDGPPPSDEPPPPVLLEHTALVDGTATYTDQTKSTPVSETIAPINLEFEQISTLPGREGSHHLTATIAESGILDWRGKIRMEPVSSEGELHLGGFKLASAFEFFRDQVNLSEASGELTLAARYGFKKGKEKADLNVSGIAATLADLKLVEAGGAEPILALDKIELADASFDLAQRILSVPQLALGKGKVQVAMDEAGAANWQKLVKAGSPGKSPQPPASQAAAPPEPPLRVNLGALKIGEVALDYTDASRRSPIQVAVGALGLDLGAEIETGAGAPKVLIKDLGLQLNRIVLGQPGKKDALANVEALMVQGGRLDLAHQSVDIRQVAVKGGGTAIVREASGEIALVEVFAPKDRGAIRREVEAIEQQSVQEGKPWHLAVEELGLENSRVAIVDRSFTPNIAYDLENIHAALKSLRNDGKTPITFDAGLRVKQGGSLRASGTVSQKGDQAVAELQVERLNLKPLQPAVARQAALKLESAAVSTKLKVTYKQGKSRPSLKAVGGAGLDALLLREAQSGKRFLAWKSLSVNGIDFSLEPDKLAIKEIRILEPGANIEIFQNQNTNIAAVFNPKGSPASTTRKPAPNPIQSDPPPPKGKASGKPSKPDQPFPVTVERVRFDQGQIDFSDLSLVLPFTTHIYDFHGSASGISTSPTSRTLLQFEGRVDDYGEAKVFGSLSPLQHKVFSDVIVVFRNVEMTSLSPYSGTFAGRKIESGKLDMELQYKIENSRLRSENTIVLDHFTLGDRVESPKAVSLPLDLAIALLTDSEGKINAAIPVEGDVDNPEFAYGKLVWEAFVTLVTKVVSAPFNAIAGVFGGGGEDLGAIRFEPGRAVLPPPEREKLQKVAQALSERPKVRVAVHGGFDPQLDGRSLKYLAIRRTLAAKLGVELPPGEDPGPVAFDSAKTQRALEELAGEREGAGATDRFQAEYEKAQDRPIKRVGTLAALVGRASEDAAFYQALYEHLVDRMPSPDQELAALGKRREEVVLKALESQPGLSRARVVAGTVGAISADGDRVPTKLDLVAAEGGG